MKYAVLSDIHGNLPALTAVLADVPNVDGYISLGDVVNYGPWSNECIAALRKLKSTIFIMGNHEEMFLDRKINNCTAVAQAFFDFCLPSFTEFEFIKTFHKSSKAGSYTLIHTLFNKYIFPDTQVVLDNNYFIGHSHHQFLTKNSGFCLYNPGSVGQNRKNLAQAEYLIYDSSLNTVELKSCTYDVRYVISRMKELKYPSICIDYYNSKVVGV